MGWIYNSDELKTKQDYINQFNEINAYATLDGEDFDFGTGVINNDMSYGSEDAYYEMELQDLAEIIEYWEDEKPKKKSKRKQRRDRRSMKQKENQRMEFLKEIHWGVVTDMNGFNQRIYRGKRSRYLKKKSNKQVRKYKDKIASGAGYRKVFDFWWELY